ncbi:MAG TPA: B-box zinc finger protein [Planctomycetota bacterium]|nr:B-box zinc finger protein [Planctomycetota bacterium]
MIATAMVRTCAKHPERAASTACRQCKAAVCPACAVVAAVGSFCSAECQVLFLALKETPERRAARRAGWGGQSVVVLACLFGLLLGIHGAARAGLKPARAVDVIGRLFEGLDKLKDERR